MELAGARPGSALALNLGGLLQLHAGLLHRHAGVVAWNSRAPGDDEAASASALESYHRHAAPDAFSAAARLAPDCAVPAVDHTQALADWHWYEDAQAEFLRVLNPANLAWPAAPRPVHNVVYDKKAMRRDAVGNANLAMERFAARTSKKILPLEAVKLLDTNDLGGRDAEEAQGRAKLLAETRPYSPRAQLLRAYIDLAPVRALDMAAMDKKLLLRRAFSTVSQAAENFDSKLMVALFHAKLLFVLDESDAVEGECRRALCIETPNDPNWDGIPPMAALGADSDARVSYVKKQLRVLLKQIIVVAALGADSDARVSYVKKQLRVLLKQIIVVAALGADSDARVSYVKKQLRVLLKQIIVVAALYWSSMKHALQGQRVVSVTVDTLHAHHDEIDKSAAKTISDARRFLKNQYSWSFWICLNSSCDGKKFLGTSSLWQHMCSKHRDELWGKLQLIIDPEYCEVTSQDDHSSLDGTTLSHQPDAFLLPRVHDMFESLLLSPSLGIQAESFTKMRQRKCGEESEILVSIREKLRMLPSDTLSTEFQECCSGIANLWLKFLEFTVVDYPEVILPVSKSFQWIEPKIHIGLGDVNTNIIRSTIPGAHDRIISVEHAPNIAQYPHGLNWEFKTRGEGDTKCAYGPSLTVALHPEPHPHAPLLILPAAKSWEKEICGPLLFLSNFARPGMCCFFPYCRKTYWRADMSIDINDVLHSNGEWFLLREDRTICLWDVNMERKWFITEVDEIVHQGYFTGKPPYDVTIVLAQQHPPKVGKEAITIIWLKTAGVDGNWQKETVKCSNEHKGLYSLTIHKGVLFWLNDTGRLCCVRQASDGLKFLPCEGVVQTQGMNFSLVQHLDSLYAVRCSGYLPPEDAAVYHFIKGGSLAMLHSGLNGRDIFTIPKTSGFVLSSRSNKENKVFTANVLPNADCVMYSYEHKCNYNIKPCENMHLACSAVWATL